jgi:hypothetical protein
MGYVRGILKSSGITTTKIISIENIIHTLKINGIKETNRTLRLYKFYRLLEIYQLKINK